MRRWGAILLVLCMVVMLAGCGKKPSGSEGRTGETMETYFFDFTVNGASLASAYEGYVPAEGDAVLVVDVTVRNTFHTSIEMYDTDFWLRWGEESGQAAYPITTDPDTFEELEPLGENQLPGTYQMPVNQERTGELVFEVPADTVDFSIWTLEEFDNGTEEGETGDYYIVYFSAETQGS